MIGKWFCLFCFRLIGHLVCQDVHHKPVRVVLMLNGQQEIWAYKNPRQQFAFTKAGSVYHPDHYVLVRDKQYTEDWYMTVDLWRKSRF